MEKKQILEEFRLTLALIKSGMRVDYDRYEFVFKQLKDGDTSFYKDIEAILLASLNRYKDYPEVVLKMQENANEIDKLSYEFHLESAALQIKAEVVDLSKFFGNLREFHKDVMSLYVKKYGSVEDRLWKAIFDCDPKVTEQWLLSLVPNAVMSSEMVDLFFQKMWINRLSVLKVLNPDQVLSAGQCNIIRYLYDEGTAYSILERLKCWPVM